MTFLSRRGESAAFRKQLLPNAAGRRDAVGTHLPGRQVLVLGRVGVIYVDLDDQMKQLHTPVSTPDGPNPYMGEHEPSNILSL